MGNHEISSSDAGKPQVKIRNPVIILTITMVVTWAVVGFLGWHSFKIYLEAEESGKKDLRIHQLKSTIVHLDEVLTMSARMAAATGDLKWEKRYHDFEPALTAAIDEAIEIAPHVHDCEFVDITHDANMKLVAMQTQAFDLVRQGRLDEAQSILFSEEYEEQKWIYAQGMTGFSVKWDLPCELEVLRGSIVHLDEVLTMSARMAAVTGDLDWEKRYHRYEPKLDAAIKDAIKLAPEAFQSEAVSSTDAANTKLVEMEKRAFELIRQDRADEAKALLFSDEYENQKLVYAEGMKVFDSNLSDLASESMNREQRNANMYIFSILVIATLLIVFGIIVFRSFCVWKTILTENNENLAQQAEDLVVMNLTLDQQVKERTEELGKSEEQFRSLFENSMDAIFWADPETLIAKNCNKAAEKLLEKSKDEIIGQHQATIHPSEKAGAYVEKFSKLMEEKGYFSENAEVITTSGKIKLCDITASVTDIQGELIIQAVIRDVTDQKQMEAEIATRIEELEEFNLMAVNRELRMIELKEEINRLLAELGKTEKYEIDRCEVV